MNFSNLAVSAVVLALVSPVNSFVVSNNHGTTFRLNSMTENYFSSFSTNGNGTPLDTTGPSVPTSAVGVPTVAAVPKLAQRWRKSTKQLATLGPASSSFEMIEKLFLAGADVFRLNFSHGAQEQKLELLQIIRQIEQKYSHPIAVLGDLQGPKLRVGEFSEPVGFII